MSDIANSAVAVAANPSPYLTIKHAQALFDTAPEKLTSEQRQKVAVVVARQREIENRILASRQAANISVRTEAIDGCIAEISGRFASEAEFVCDMARNGLSIHGLREDVERDLRVEAILENISSHVPPVSNLEAELFYHLHFERFRQQEKRTLRHILITINSDFKGNSREEALKRIGAIRDVLLKSPDRFAEQALRHSECPTAMQGGVLGQVPRGQLYPELESVAFSMHPGCISEVLESPVGFHILRCDNIQPAGMVPLTTVRGRIREQMLKTRRENKQRAWVRSLMAG